MRILILGVSSLLLWGCGVGGGQRPEIAIYDLEPAGPIDASMPPGLIGRIEVQAPSWLATSAMQYRLAAEPGRRRDFAQSRWAAPPAELLEGSLRRHLTSSGTCRLRLELDEWIQSFGATGDSQAHLAVRTVLTARRGTEPLAVHRFDMAQDAGRNAIAGASAFATLGRRLATDIAKWAVDQERRNPRLAAVCAQ